MGRVSAPPQGALIACTMNHANDLDAAGNGSIVDQIARMDEAPWTFVAYPNYTMARKADLKGWTYYTSNNVRFQDFSRG